MKMQLATIIYCFLGILVTSIQEGRVEGSCKYLTEKRTNDGFLNLALRYAPMEAIQAGVFGFRFSKAIINFTVYGPERSKIKLSDELWFAIENQTYNLELFEFDVLVQHGEKPPTVVELSVNGRIIWRPEEIGPRDVLHKVSAPNGIATNDAEQNKTLSEQVILTLCASLIPCLILGIPIIFLIIFVKKLAATTDQKWMETFSLVLSIDRNISVNNNPNRKGVPLPNPPNRDAPCDAATYLDLQHYQCNDQNGCQNYGVLLEILQKLDYSTAEDLKTDAEERCNRWRAVTEKVMQRICYEKQVQFEKTILQQHDETPL